MKRTPLNFLSEMERSSADLWKRAENLPYTYCLISAWFLSLAANLVPELHNSFADRWQLILLALVLFHLHLFQLGKLHRSRLQAEAFFYELVASKEDEQLEVEDRT